MKDDIRTQMIGGAYLAGWEGCLKALRAEGFNTAADAVTLPPDEDDLFDMTGTVARKPPELFLTATQEAGVLRLVLHQLQGELQGRWRLDKDIVASALEVITKTIRMAAGFRPNNIEKAAYEESEKAFQADKAHLDSVMFLRRCLVTLVHVANRDVLDCYEEKIKNCEMLAIGPCTHPFHRDETALPACPACGAF